MLQENMGDIVSYSDNDDFNMIFSESCNSVFNAGLVNSTYRNKIQLEVVQWLYKAINGINVSYDNESPFRIACETGNLEIAKWLLEMKPTIDISTENNYAFIRSCVQGYFDVANWLVTIEPSILSYDTFLIAFETGCLDPSIVSYEAFCNKILSSFKVEEKVEIEFCSLCEDNVSDIKTKCLHSCCEGCIKKWLKRSNKCPFCREKITDI